LSCEVVRDVATAALGETNVLVGAPTTADAIKALDDTAEVRDAYPLILSTDNGPAYTSDVFERRLEDLKIVHLKNTPHTPKHNAFAERAVRELKDEIAYVEAPPAPLPVHSTAAYNARLRIVRARLRKRPRRSRRGLSSQQLDNEPCRAYDPVSRSLFFAAAREALAAARRAHEKPRARRLAEREAILGTAVRFGLIKIRRGGTTWNPAKAESNS
jgi:transposase InsO family protein